MTDALTHCITLVDQGDPDRAHVLRAASDAARARLYPIYALNLEIARAPWASAEPLVAEMRLQWWADALQDLTTARFARPHPVLQACAHLPDLPQAGVLMERLIEARRRDIWHEPFNGDGALWDHLAATGGGLMELSGTSLGATDTETLQAFGTASALAQWLRAVPDLTARGLHPLPDPSPKAIAALARDGLSRLRQARRQRGPGTQPALPALLTGWHASTTLRAAMRDPEAVTKGRLPAPGPFSPLALMMRALTGRW
jgi:phytoene/squalene synthetase